MKRSVFFKVLLLALLPLLTVSCVEREEIAFEGVVVGTRSCSGLLMDDNMGLLVALTSPDSIGGRLVSTSGEVMDNVVVLYEPPRILYVEDHIHGSFYLDDKYSRANCSVVWDEMDLPEGVFLNVTVD
ncbi:MAG: hypothetical protein K6E96_00300 [Bacteroidales bacterium]|nr:hypothetical protein [Bacteroidales bacterium]